MKQVTIENVKARIAQIENAASVMLPAGLGLSLKHEFELACLRALLGMMQSVQVLPSGWRMVPTEPQAAPEKYNIGEATMLHIFTATGMTDVSDMQAVFDQVEKALVKLERKPKVIEPDGWRDMMTRLANGLELMTSLASERAISVDTCVCLEWVRDARAMLNQAQGPATDNTAQQFEALATSAGSGKQPDSELEKAKRCLPYHLDDRYKVNGSWIGSVQNYIVTLEQKLEENGIDIDGDDDE